MSSITATSAFSASSGLQAPSATSVDPPLSQQGMPPTTATASMPARDNASHDPAHAEFGSSGTQPRAFNAFGVPYTELPSGNLAYAHEDYWWEYEHDRMKQNDIIQRRNFGLIDYDSDTTDHAHRRGAGASNTASAPNLKVISAPPPSATTADPALSQQVLSGRMLELIATYLPVPSLVAAAATNTAFQLALTSQQAWQDSSWHIDGVMARRVRSTYCAASVRRLHHLTFAPMEFFRSPMGGFDELFFSRLPTMHHLVTLTSLDRLTLPDAQRFPKLRTLVLGGDGQKLIPGLSQLPTLQHLYVSGQAPSVQQLIAATAPLSHVHVHVNVTGDMREMAADELCAMLEAVHNVHAVIVQLTCGAITKIVQHRPWFFDGPPATSSLRELHLTLAKSYQHVSRPVPTRLEAVRLLTQYYHSITQLRVQNSENLNDNWLQDELTPLNDHCRKHQISLTHLRFP